MKVERILGASLALTASIVLWACGTGSDSDLFGGSASQNASSSVASGSGSGGTGTTGGNSTVASGSGSGGQGAGGATGTGGGAAGGAGPAGPSSSSGAGGMGGTSTGPGTGGTGGMAPDGGDMACPPQKPVIGSPCNIFINNTSCVYGNSNCFCMIASWSCVP